MSTFRTTMVIAASPGRVLEALVEPRALTRWAPVPYRIVALQDGRLRTGSHARVEGQLAGIGASFDVHVLRIDSRRVVLRATGPVVMDVTYELRGRSDGTEVLAQITVRCGRRLLSPVLAAAIEGVLRAGALKSALVRLSREVQGERAELAAA